MAVRGISGPAVDDGAARGRNAALERAARTAGTRWMTVGVTERPVRHTSGAR